MSGTQNVPYGILKRAIDYYENSKEVLREKAKNKYREFSEEEKI